MAQREVAESILTREDVNNGKAVLAQPKLTRIASITRLHFLFFVDEFFPFQQIIGLAYLAYLMI